MEINEAINNIEALVNTFYKMISKIDMIESWKTIKKNLQTDSQQKQHKICPECKGSGYSENFRGPDYGYQCENCNGTGKVKTT